MQCPGEGKEMKTVQKEEIMLPTITIWIQQIVFCQTYNEIQIYAIKSKKKKNN